ncbi:hypothetical protein CUMW_065490 [Citrus unshiu]|nr:hypothetical protein CUMW_065490 [Citrus unshiu]
MEVDFWIGTNESSNYYPHTYEGVALNTWPCSTFELLAACMRRCRTIALQLDPKYTVQFSCLVDALVAFPAVRLKGGALCNNPLGHAVALAKKAKAEMSKEHIRSAAYLMEVKGRRPRYPIKGNYNVSDLSRSDLIELIWGGGNQFLLGLLVPKRRWGDWDSHTYTFAEAEYEEI